MGGEVQQLRGFIEHCLRGNTRASLVEVVGRFDHDNHSLPSAWRLNQAIAALALPVILSPDGLHLEASDRADAVQLSDVDMSRVIEAYRKALGCADQIDPAGIPRRSP